MGNKLNLRKVYIFLALIGWLCNSSQTLQVGSNQTAPPPFKDLTKLPANYLSWKNTLPLQNLVASLKHDTCLNKKFSIVFYLIQDSATLPPYSPNYINPAYLTAFTNNSITPAINMLNNEFKRICVSFQNCSTVVIPNYPFNNWSQLITENVVTSNWYTTKTINFYLPMGVGGPGVGGINNSGGYTYFPGVVGNKDIIVMGRGQITSSVAILHFMGHFFGLPNTQDEISAPGFPSAELVNRTNCYTNGDGFCDTEADCWPSGFNYVTPPIPPCHFDYGPQDIQSKYYTPPVDNYMSEYSGACRCKYTQEQWNFMARVMMTSKFYLH